MSHLLFESALHKLLLGCVFIFLESLLFLNCFFLLLKELFVQVLLLFQMVEQAIVLDWLYVFFVFLLELVDLVVELSVGVEQVLEGFLVLLPRLLSLVGQVLLEYLRGLRLRCQRLGVLHLELLLLGIGLIGYDVVTDLGKV